MIGRYDANAIRGKCHLLVYVTYPDAIIPRMDLEAVFLFERAASKVACYYRQDHLSSASENTNGLIGRRSLYLFVSAIVRW